jgi:hypothetical protein
MIAPGWARRASNIRPYSSVREERSLLYSLSSPDLGWMISRFGSLVVPKLRFWFDAANHGDYLAHCMPLYSGGPEVVVMREGVSARGLQP